MHAKKIMHRDIKPENIIIKKKEGKISDIILADFGLSEHIEKKKFYWWFGKLFFYYIYQILIF